MTLDRVVAQLRDQAHVPRSGEVIWYVWRLRLCVPRLTGRQQKLSIPPLASRFTMADITQLRDKFTAILDGALLRRRKLRNELAPVHRLPVEILCVIFLAGERGLDLCTNLVIRPSTRTGERWR